jgi:hypothetical protein
MQKLTIKYLVLPLILTIFCSPWLSFGGNIKCQRPTTARVSTISISHWRLFDNYQNYNYEAFDRVLFLNDGGKAAQLVTPTRTDQLFISTDFAWDKVNVPEARISRVQIDNNQIPFKKNSFELIVMNRGLCPCRGTITCGGIDTKKAPMKKFLVSAIDLMNAENPNSIALFTGFYFPGIFQKKLPTLWRQILNEIQSQYPALEFRLLQSSTQYPNWTSGFLGIAVTVRSDKSIEDKLRNLGAPIL